MDDALQEAYLRAYRGLPRHGHSAFGTWLYRIVYRTCLDELRRRRPVGALDEAAEVPDFCGRSRVASFVTARHRRRDGPRCRTRCVPPCG